MAFQNKEKRPNVNAKSVHMHGKLSFSNMLKWPFAWPTKKLIQPDRLLHDSQLQNQLKVQM